MSIATKTGDGGYTTLFSGEKVSKSDIRIEINGILDELDCHLGEARLYLQNDDNKQLVYRLQQDLKMIMMVIATKGNYELGIMNCEEKLPAIDYLDEYLIRTEPRYPQTKLIIPGESIPSVKLDICRTIARRAERWMVRLLESGDEGITATQYILPYINRLSDVLFIMARSESLSK